ncbi:type III pantothenate kinase [Nitrosomonas aestuarii]|uniref:type III pantothenate kinase n=1 Tax=Nitrosomonas aestuarii TaxID=52441 RepID=UPI000D3013EC|nr:type III pantothenate kinase [Nitrosomonas aestuarii]PTN13048.1 type III pantothenate kinase [Nitrosomonas aestuarii]
MFSLLAIDSGNSYLKWAYFENNQCISHNKILNQEITQLSDSFSSLKQPDLILISQVSDQRIKDQISSFFKNWGSEPRWIYPLTKQCGVTNNYDNPGQLGSDRWASLIAAWHKYHASCLVVNIGTAMTVDALSNDGVFLGGIILPGPHLMWNSVLLNTQIFNNNDDYRYEIFPVETKNALYSGIIQSLVGSIERMRHLFHLNHGSPPKNCIISGGGVADILPHFDFEYTFIDNLVLEGLNIIANDMKIANQA